MFAVSGLASGIDSGALISQLLELERRPIIPLQEREADIQVELSTYGTLQGLMSSLKSAVGGLQDATGFLSYAAASSDEALFTASADDTVAPGVFDIGVYQLAQSQKLRSEGFVSLAEVVGEGTLHLSVGAGTVTDIEIGATDTVQDVAAAINGSSAGVKATTIYDGSQYFLAFSVEATGTENVIHLRVTDADGDHTNPVGLSSLAYEAGVTENLTQTQAPQDAKISVDGITDITRPSNTIRDVIAGVTLTLHAGPLPSDDDDQVAPASRSATLTVSRSTEPIRTKLQGLFDAYNEIQAFFAKEQQYDASTGTAGTLLGDSTANMIRRRLSEMLAHQFAGFLPEADTLADFGIGTNAEGKWEITSDTRFDQALSTNLNAVIDFFTQDTSTVKGFAAYTMAMVDGILDAETGILSARRNSLNQSIERINKDIATIEERVAATEQRLEKQFINLEKVISQLQTTEAYLTQQLAGLQNLSVAIANRG